MIFSELYSAYYNAVAAVLNEAVGKKLTRNEIRAIIEKHAFGESVLNIEPALAEERWQLIRKDGTTPLKHVPTMPLTTLEKRWIRAIWMDPRIRLFTDGEPNLPDTEPLFTPEDVKIFDRYSDGDPYEDPEYIRNFRLILDAIKNHYPLNVYFTNSRGRVAHKVVIPHHLEYSEKDDKFRLISTGSRLGETINVGRILKCKLSNRPFEWREPEEPSPRKKTVEFELTDRRNSLERVLLHFAHFEKEAERIGDDRYRIKVTYDRQDETEMVIRILSFGPVIKVISPRSFVDLIKERLLMQKSCGQ